LGLAVWYMDDGSKLASGGYNIFTNSFLKEELDEIIPILSNKFNLKVTIHKRPNKKNNGMYYILYISVKSANIFETLIEPYMIESMKYKLNKKIYKYNI